jgi:hypothetical protein
MVVQRLSMYVKVLIQQLSDRADAIVGGESCGCFLREKEIRVSC